MFIGLSIKQWYVGYFSKQGQIPYHPSTLPSGSVHETPHAFIAKIISNQSQQPTTTLLKVLHTCLIFRDHWEGRCLIAQPHRGVQPGPNQSSWCRPPKIMAGHPRHQEHRPKRYHLAWWRAGARNPANQEWLRRCPGPGAPDGHLDGRPAHDPERPALAGPPGVATIWDSKPSFLNHATSFAN